MRYCTFIFSMSCSIASVTSYLSGIEAKIYKMATSILLKFLTLKWNISRTIWRIEVGDGSFFCIFHALSFELNFVFDRRFPLIISFVRVVQVNEGHLHSGLYLLKLFSFILTTALFSFVNVLQSPIEIPSQLYSYLISLLVDIFAVCWHAVALSLGDIRATG